MTTTLAASDDFFADAFARRRVMVILRGFSPDDAVRHARTAWNAGITLVEVPIQDDAAIASLEAVIAAAPAGHPVGSGTVTDVARVEASKAAGAVFTVAPGWDPVTAEASLDAGLPHLPGVATASEVHAATAGGRRWLKAFPASLLGSEWVTAMHGPFPLARFVVTGGVDTRNADAFLAAGADAVSLGSSFAQAPAEELTRIGA
jgi:2-dehydro-3-deoxyphosphogluconate aldolase/(4S)-4-hydroxy-2-oxoglutarate aldolase